MSLSSYPPPPADEPSADVAGDALAEALRLAEAAPERDDLWDAAETLAASLQRPDEVAAAHRRALDGNLAPDVAASLGRRAVQFYDEWFADGVGLVDVLARVLAVAPATSWAFQRLSLLLTHAERWEDLLALYDSALAATPEGDEQRVLLDEAAHIAKDFVGDPDRAIGYLRRLFVHAPQDTQLAMSLERLLEKQGRHRELIDLWSARLGELPTEAMHATRWRIAVTWLERLAAPAEALAAAEPLLTTTLAGDAAQLLEDVLGRADAPSPARARALEGLREHHAATGNRAALVRVLILAIPFLEGDACDALHRQIAGLLVEEGRSGEALDHYAVLLLRRPDDEENRTTFRTLAAATEHMDRYAAALAEAADLDTLEETARTSFLLEAAETFVEPLGEPARAIALYERILAQPAVAAPLLLDVARRTVALLEHADRPSEFLRVLEQLAALEPDATDRRRVLGQLAARAADAREFERALAAWERCLAADSTDHEALDAVVALLEQGARWEPLVAALRRRSDVASDPAARRADLLRSAAVQEEHLRDVPAAIATWSEVLASFGEDQATVDALARLFAVAGRWNEFTDLLEGAAERERDPVRQAQWLAALGDAYDQQLALPARAAERYAAALRLEPRQDVARQGMTALLSREETIARATVALATAYETTDEWSLTLSLLEPRLLVATHDDDRVTLLLEAARLSEERAEDPHGALSLVGRAFPLALARHDVESELQRLGQRTGAWSDVVAAYTAALDVLGERELATADVRLRRAALRQRELGDLAGALADAQEVAARAPDRQDATAFVLQVAGHLGRWGDAATQLLASVQTDQAASAFGAWEAIADETSGWDAAMAALSDAAATASALPPAIAHDLYVQIALWQRDRRQDPAAAEVALRQAVAVDDAKAPTLALLATLQRRHPGPELVTTLLRLADVGPDEAGALREAAEVALANDAPTGEAIVRRLWETSTTAWKNAAGDERSADLAHWSLERLVELALADGRTALAIDLLVQGAEAPLTPPDARELRHRAATVAAGPGQDAGRAIALYQRILEDDRGDERAMAALSSLYEAEGRLVDLLALQRHELQTLSPPVIHLFDDPPVSASPSSTRAESPALLQRRLTLRLAMAQHFGTLGQLRERIDVLRENLSDWPGHGDSIQALVDVLTANGDERTLADLLTEQAEHLGTTDEAAALWVRVATVAEDPLGDIARAVAAYERALALAPTVASLDALARLHESQGDYARAVVRRQQRLDATTGRDRSATVAQLARAHLGAGDAEAARICLEAGLGENPAATDVRRLLAEHYRAVGAWEPLVTLLQEGVAYAFEPDAQLALLREAADGLMHRLQRPDDAIVLLRRAIDLAPDDRTLRTTLAEALRATGRLDEAWRLLEELLEGFGRRRPPERAAVHFQLAHVAQARGDGAEALAQLEVAAAMDVSHPAILRSLAEVARENGQLERAERAYRALLLIVRRQGTSEAEDGLTASEVMLELHRLAGDLGQPERAREILESALETAGQNEREAVRFEHALRVLGELDLLQRALRVRLGRVAGTDKAAAVVTELTTLLQELGQPEEALEASLHALTAAPGDWGLHDAADALAGQLGQRPRYAERLRSLAGGVAAEHPDIAAALWLRLGALWQKEIGDNAAGEPDASPRAVEAYERAEALAIGADAPRVWRLLGPLYGRLGDRENQIRVLRLLVQTEPAPADSPAEDGPRTDAIYELAELLLASEETRDEGIQMATWALDRDATDERAAPLLQRAVTRYPASAELLALSERRARSTGDARQLLEALERVATLPDVAPETLREAVETALTLGEDERADVLLLQAAQREFPDDPVAPDVLWAWTTLIERRKAAGDFAGAVRWLQHAASRVGTAAAPSFEQEVAEIALGPLGDLALAETTYETLVQRDPADRTFWEPLRRTYQALGHTEKLAKFLESTLEATSGRDERGAIRLAYARLLREDLGRPDDAITQLQAALDENPDDGAAADALAELLTSRGSGDELATLLEQQLERARARQDTATLGAMATRLGALLAPTRRHDALDVYRFALVAAPEHRDLLRALVNLYDAQEDDPRERADAMERLLALEEGPAAVRLAQQLLQLRTELEDDEGIEHALALAFRAQPDEPAFRAQLEARYVARQAWAELAAMLVVEARAPTTSPEQALASLRQAAGLLREPLHDPASAAALLHEARQRMPADVALLGELVQALLDAHRSEDAMAELSAALAAPALSDEETVALLRWRARLFQASGDDDRAVADLEDAAARGGLVAAPDLTAALDRRRQRAREQGDANAERTALLRLAEVLEVLGEQAAAREHLAQWAGEHPTDAPVWRTVARLDLALERWDQAIEAFQALLPLEEGEARADAAAWLVDACERAGRPAEARRGLEFAWESMPEHEGLRQQRRHLYEVLGAHRELAALCLEDAQQLGDDPARYERYRYAAELLLLHEHDAAAAVAPLEQALLARPGDHDVTVLLADAYTLSGQLPQATALLEAAVATHKGRRSKELSMLHHRMARVAYAAGDRSVELAWLSAALEADMQNGHVAAELATVAMELGQFDVATKALRAVVLMKTPGPMSRAMAYLQQARILHHQGDARRALLMAKKAQTEDPNLEEAAAFLNEVRA